MNKFSYLYIVFFYLSASAFTLFGTISLEHQVIGCMIMVALFGIPHGAIDNIILLSENNVSPFKFYFWYIMAIILYVICWIYLPVFSFVVFLLLSCFHFGESQLANFKIKVFYSKFIYMLWGLAMISALFYYNSYELTNLFDKFSDTNRFKIVLNPIFLKYTFYVANFLILIFLSVLTRKKQIKIDIFFQEIFQLFLIHLTFILFPVVISFTLYFVFLHSIKVLFDEYHYLSSITKGFNLLRFLKLLIPYTIISIVFILIFMFLNKGSDYEISILLFSFISISVITLPHSFVMTNFYDKNK